MYGHLSWTSDTTPWLVYAHSRLSHDANSLSVCAYRRRKSVRDKVRETSRGMLILSSHYLDRRAFKFITVIHVDVEYIKTTDTATI